MNILQKFEQNQIEKHGGEAPDFRAGDTVRVNVRIVEGTTERIQAFEGICIARKSRGLNSSFTVRKISHGEGVERIFPLYSPRIESVQVVRRGDVRRSKLYYLRGLTGKAARIKEKMDFLQADNDTPETENVAVEATAAEAKPAKKKSKKKSEK